MLLYLTRIHCFLAVALLMAVGVTALKAAGSPNDETVIALPAVAGDSKPLLTALADRRSQREFRTNALPRQVLGNLLWAGFGVNRSENGGRTAPSAMSFQDVEIYVALREGLFVYEGDGHQLRRIHEEDIRALTGGQPYVAVAPVALIFVSDTARMTRAPEPDHAFYSAVDTGYVSQNIYLYCASEGLATVVHMAGNKEVLGKALRLRPEQRIILAQSVGYPADAVK